MNRYRVEVKCSDGVAACDTVYAISPYDAAYLWIKWGNRRDVECSYYLSHMGESINRRIPVGNPLTTSTGRIDITLLGSL